MDIALTEDLERILQHEELPGIASQLLMAPMGRERQLEPPIDYKLACVLILLYPKQDEWHISLIERSSGNLNDRHAGQISLPGGMLEESDESYEHCALRETEEEIGLSRDQIGILGELTGLYVPVSNFMIYPFVGFTTEEPEFNPSPAEVAQILEVKLGKIHKYKKTGTISSQNYTLNDVPYYDVNGHKVWGATAMILSEFEAVINLIDP